MQDTTMARAKPEELWNGPTDFKKKVAIYGGGFTRRLILDHPLVDDDCEIWSGNHVWRQDGWGADLPRLDRCFDVHDIELLSTYPGEGDREHFEWLQREHPFPIYMQDPDERFPSAVRYPYEEIVQEFFGRQYRGTEIKAAFGSMMDFITAMAIYEGADWIGYFGVEMGSSTEHRYQIPYGHVWLGVAAGRGVTTWVPDDPRCQMLRQQVYAYEGFQMISRQTLENVHKDYARQRHDWLMAAKEWTGAYKLTTGKLQAVMENGKGPGSEEAKALTEEAKKIGAKMRRAREAAATAYGAMEALTALIQIVDLEEPDTELYVEEFDDIPLEEIKA